MSETLMGIGLWQPYAGLVRIGLKTLETRPRRTHHRGPLVICATKADDPGSFDRLRPIIVPEWLSRAELDAATAARGAMCALVDVVGCRLLLPKDEPRSLFYAPDRWAWELKDIRPLAPLPVRCGQGFFRIPRSLVERALSEAA